MIISDYIEKVHFKELNDCKNKTISDLIVLMRQHKCQSFYITHNKHPIYVFTFSDILDLFINNKLNENLYEYINKNKKEIKTIPITYNILDAYYYMRSNNLAYIPVVNKNNELVGELTFKTISLKITDIAIKDPLTGLYNKRYFDVLIEEYNKFNKPIGIIFIEFTNLNILEGFYGIDVVEKLIKLYAKTLKNSVRDIDFIFKINNQLRILTFNSLEITDKILKRIKNNLEKVEYQDIKANFKISFSHVPEIDDNILLALENCEKKLIKRD